MVERGVLGCGDDYSIQLGYVARIDADGEPLEAAIVKDRGVLSGVTRVSWQRTFNAVAEAEIVFGGEIGSATCDALLEEIQPWIHEIRIFRDGERVFEGPVVTKPEVTDAGEMAVTCADVMKWFTEGHVHNKMERNYDAADPVTIAEYVIRENLTGPFALPPDFPAVLDYLHTNTIGDDIDYEITNELQPVIDILDDLTDYGLLYAAVGRRIVLSSPADTGSMVFARLHQRHFVDQIELLWDGDEIATYGWGVVGGIGDDPGIVEGYGTIGTAYGCHDAVVDLDDGNSASNARKAAANAIKGRTRPPLKIGDGWSGVMRPDAPIEIRNLRPGTASIAVQVNSAWGRTYYQRYMITDVEVSWSPGEEEVTVTLSPLGEPAQLPPPPPPPPIGISEFEGIEA